MKTTHALTKDGLAKCE